MGVQPENLVTKLRLMLFKNVPKDGSDVVILKNI
jgi:hypothetical protein